MRGQNAFIQQTFMASILKQKHFFWICAGIVLFGLLGCSKKMNKTKLPNEYPIIPTPQEMVYGGKEIFFNTASVLKGDFPNEELLLRNFLKEKGIVSDEEGIQIKFTKEVTLKNGESYELLIEDKMITITSASAKGAFYGVQTLKQLFRNKNGLGAFPEIDVADWPAFKVRGFMHDVGRNFQSVALLKEQIEVMAQYKMNIFHWHLTDNPGWRLESKIYPELQSDKTSSRNTGKFYTQEDFKDILSFCKERKITVIPEFDIPGHTAAFRRAFDLKSMKEEKVLPILLDLFDELCQLASPEEMPYIHIGTDEVRNKEEYVDHKNDLSKSFSVEDQLKDSYLIDGRAYKWEDSIVGGTIHLKHFFGFPSYTDKDNGTYYAYAEIYSPNQRIQDFWIGFQGWSRSGRRGGPLPDQGQWHTTNPKIWVNDTEVSPPIWKQPNLGIATDEIPFVDEDYFYRTPTKVTLNKGWNKILLKIPQGSTSWKWMFTCIPVHIDNEGVSEVKGLKFNTSSTWYQSF